MRKKAACPSCALRDTEAINGSLVMFSEYVPWGIVMWHMYPGDRNLFSYGIGCVMCWMMDHQSNFGLLST